MGRLENELLQLEKKIGKMSRKLVKMTHDSVEAVVTRNSKLAQHVIDRDDEIDKLDMKIDELSTKVLGLYEPKADDLRFAVTNISIAKDLERVGDHCVSISREAIKINELPQIKPYVDLPRMGAQVEWMLTEAFDAYFSKNTAKALDVIKSDDIVDECNKKIINELVEIMKDDVIHNQVAVSLIHISRSLERIADYATNICEICFFITEGKRIKHVYLSDEDNA